MKNNYFFKPTCCLPKLPKHRYLGAAELQHIQINIDSLSPPCLTLIVAIETEAYFEVAVNIERICAMATSSGRLLFCNNKNKCVEKCVEMWLKKQQIL